MFINRIEQKLIKVIIVFIYCCILPLYGAEKLSTENDKYLVRIKDIKPMDCCPRQKKFTIEIFNKKSQTKKEIFIPGKKENDYIIQEFGKVNKVIIAGQLKLVVLGESIDEKNEIIMVVDMDKNEVEGVFWPGEYSFSPTNRFVVFATGEYGGRNIVLVYDFLKTYSDNVIEDREYLGTLAELDYVGFPIFPEINAKKRTYDTELEIGHYSLSPFLWSKDENKIIFVEYFDKEKQNYIVVVDIKGGLEKPRIVKKPIKFEDVLSISKEELERKLTKETKEHMNEIGFRFLIRNMWWEGTDVVVMEPEYRECYLYEGYKFKIGDLPLLYSMIAPRPLLLLGRNLDKISTLEEQRIVKKEVMKIYKSLEKREYFSYYLEDGGHDFSYTMRERAYKWLEKWL